MLRRLISGIGLGLAGALCCTALLVAAPSHTPVADAAMLGNNATVKNLLEHGADVNAAQADGMTALHWAAVNGDVDLAKMLMYAGADVNASTRVGGYTALDIAAKDGHAEMVEALLKGGADPNGADEHGTTPLMLASASGNVQAVSDLLTAGAKVNAVESVKHETALMFAAANGRTDVVNALLDHGADWRPTTAILNWTKLPKGDPRLPDFSKFFSKNYAKKGAKGKPGATAAAPGAAKAGVKPAVMQAADKAPAPKKADAVDANVVVAQPNRGAQAGAGGNGDNPFLKYPKEVGTQGGLTALLFAARQGYTDTVQALLKHGADINQIDPGDHTSPLMIAIINGRFDLADQMLKEGANPNLAEVSGATPLYAVLNCVWSDKALYPQPTAYKQQKTGYLTLMKDL
ncbi:MAG: ankyrin repeat domain-containing protein, partial [Acidobacteriota bacterium]|nr:ankyrin repeat domain-containing protein [Acidobacteriota bacterium]